MKTSSNKILELAVDSNLMESRIVLEEIKEIARFLSLELDLVRDRRKAQEKQFQEFMTELWSFLDKLAAKYCIDRQLLNLVNEPKAGEQKWEGTSSGRQSIHERFAGNTN